jgi:alpha-D-ribose 1-methylphosphonate 5-triphosphate synthase subunit PhnH
VRALGLDPVHDTRATFRALCDAMARPGTVREVPGRADRAVAATLVDHEVTLHTTDDGLREALEAEGRYEPADPTAADVVHADGVPSWDVRELRRGTLVEPSDGATAIYRVDALSTDVDDPGAATTVRLAGPGVPSPGSGADGGVRTLGVGLPAAELAGVAEAGSTYPRGVDAVLATDDRVAAIPRSVTLEVA